MGWWVGLVSIIPLYLAVFGVRVKVECLTGFQKVDQAASGQEKVYILQSPDANIPVFMQSVGLTTILTDLQDTTSPSYNSIAKSNRD